MWRKVSGAKAWLKTLQMAWRPGGDWHAVAWRQAPILGMAISLLAGQSIWRQKNLALPMLTGRLEGRGPDLIAHNRVWLAMVLLLSVLAYISWEIYSAAL